MSCSARDSGSEFFEQNLFTTLGQTNHYEIKHSSFRCCPLRAFLVIATATGCKNTANGAGKDIEKMGEKIQEKTQ